MKKVGTVVNNIEERSDDAAQIVRIMLDTPEQALCTLGGKAERSGGTGCSGRGCAVCGRCAAEKGLLVVDGKHITALNCTGQALQVGDKVVIFVSEKLVALQTLTAMIFPIGIAGLGYVLSVSYTGNEGIALAAMLGGGVIGAVFAAVMRKCMHNKALPLVISKMTSPLADAKAAAGAIGAFR